MIHYRPLGDVRDDLRRSYQDALQHGTPIVELSTEDAFVVLRALGAVKRQRRPKVSAPDPTPCPPSTPLTS